jgi:hypothetical protein
MYRTYQGLRIKQGRPALIFMILVHMSSRPITIESSMTNSSIFETQGPDTPRRYRGHVATRATDRDNRSWAIPILTADVLIDAAVGDA